MNASVQTVIGTPRVEISDLHKFFSGLYVLRDIDLIAPPDSATILIGPSGPRKSTLLRCISKLKSISTGRIEVGGDLVRMREIERGGCIELHTLSDKVHAAQRARIGMVFQRFNLFPHIVTLQNVMEASVLVRKISKAKAYERGTELLERVGLGDRPDHYPSRLSGGQQRQVAIARALAMDSELVLFGEPTSVLDPELVGEVLQMMEDLVASGMTMIVVTHEMDFTREVDDRLIFVGGSVVVEWGIPSEVLDRPANKRARTFPSSVL